MSILLIDRKSMSSTISQLTSVNTKLFFQNLLSSSLILYRKSRDYYHISLQNSAVDFLGFNICLSDLETLLASENLAHYIDFAS